VSTFISVQLQGAVELQALWAKAPDIVRQELTSAMYESELLVERNVREGTPEGAYRNLKGSIAAQTPQVSADSVLGVIGTSAPYAVPVELGTKPHFPPILPLVDWVIAKLGVPEKEAKGVAFLVARKISRKGTKGAAMFQRGFEKSERLVQQIFDRARSRVVDRLAGTS
jgi:hypothetical protein